MTAVIAVGVVLVAVVAGLVFVLLRVMSRLNATAAASATPAPATLGEESWKWLLLQPLTIPSTPRR